MTQLDELRAKIDKLDRELVELLNQRAALSIEIGKAKAGNRNVYAPGRESEILRRLEAESAGPLPGDALRAIYSEIISSSRALQAPLTVAFLGPEHNFTHQAALAHFGHSTRFLPVPSNPDVFEETELGRADYGIVAIENSTEGAVGATLDSFVNSELKACAEVRLDIHQAFMSRVPMDQVKVVYSHPQSLGQCRNWLRTHLSGVPLVEMASNVAAVQRAAQEEGSAAIGPEVAAALYGLEVLEPRAEDVAGNVTRFLVIGRHMAERTGHDRMSLLFSIKDRVGVLRDVLAIFAQAGVNLTKIESRPIKHRPWDYVFFADLDAHPEDPGMAETLARLHDLTVFTKVLGAWPATEIQNSK
ncbi:MAG: prephenate dehydratase [Chloroflexota bacterium]|nr:prephenate dehydratase [Chloroflexota bacterium]